MCLLNNDVSYYYFVAQGKTSIPGVDDAEEMRITDVSPTNEPQAAPTYCVTFTLCYS